jgi:uncharacterized protein (DUF736 family)
MWRTRIIPFSETRHFTLQVHINTTNSHTEKQDEKDAKGTRRSGNGINSEAALAAKTSRETESTKSYLSIKICDPFIRRIET